jgi:hypothetical protein
MLDMVSLYQFIHLYLHTIQNLNNMCLCFINFTHQNRMTSGKSFIRSFRCQFFDKSTSYPSDVWVKIVTRMNVDVFQYKVLVIPSMQDNHKLLYVVLGLENVLNCGKDNSNCDHTCIIHLEVRKQVMNQSLVSITANKIRLLMNMLYCTGDGQENNKTVNPFRTRMMPLRWPEGENT